MAKSGGKSAYVQLLKAQKELAILKADIDLMKGFTIQQCQDMAQIALNSEFGFGPDRNARFAKAFRETFLDYAQLCVDDSKDDDEIVYTQEKVDRALRVACGDGILPFQQRYASENLYFRERDLKK